MLDTSTRRGEQRYSQIQMRLCHLPLSLLAVCISPVLAAGTHWSLAEDFYAFPKYRVSFLNGLPVLNETAEQWLRAGLKGGIAEFLDQPWQEQSHQSHGRPRSIESSDTRDVASPEKTQETINSSQYSLERMKLSGKNPFICLIPPPMESHIKPIEEPEFEVSPAQSLSLLQPLANTCIYHRQGWFTYAYCHNNRVRQFREMAYAHPHHAGYVPEEDPEWEAYTLGEAPNVSGEGGELRTAQQEALENSVDIVKSAGHRYLVQKMGGGTLCDKTGLPRQIEVQFHCSQTVTDMILFVKETSTCHYVMVIHTPRLCGEPGFRTRLEQREEAVIQCREILDSPETIATVDKTLPAASHPPQYAARQIPDVSNPPPPVTTAKGDNRHSVFDKKTEDMLKAAVEAMLTANSGRMQHVQDGGDAILVSGEDGEMLIDIEFVDADDADDALEKFQGLLDKASGKLSRLEEALRAAGYDVSQVSPATADTSEMSGEEEKQDKKASGGDKKPNHEEL